MVLNPGARLGPYEITAQIGEGGMGEVYRAIDTNLKRAVAIKVLPASVASDKDRLARFQREAEVLASLNHPNIAAIHGLERSDGGTALVMELVEGPTLAELLADRRAGPSGPAGIAGSKGPGLPVEEALPIAKQIAEALEAAHEQGVIHRDLKPANIKLRPDGVVKVLDFGLAKLTGPPSAYANATADKEAGHYVPGATASPTITSPALMTGAGMLLGTAAYMSPEQARGKPVDKRSDIWAFGCVLYEMLTGKRAFDGEDVSETIANVLKSEPVWSALPSATPSPIRRLLRRSLEKDRTRRLAEAASLRLDIDDALAKREQEGTPVAAGDVGRGLPAWRRLAVAACLGAAAAAGVAALIAARATRASTAPSVARLSIVPPASALPRVAPANSRDLAITPDGRHVVYVSARSQGAQLFVRRLDALDVAPLGPAGTARNNLFVSPDGQWVAFTADGGQLMKQPLSGGPPLSITTLNGPGRGGTWLDDGTIVFATADPTTGLWRVGANGGGAVAITKPDAERQGGDHYWPHALPGSRGVLFTVSAPDGTQSIAVLDLRTGQHRVLAQGSDAQYVGSGHIVYSVSGTLHASAFDLDSLEISGAPIPLLTNVGASALGAAQFDIAGNGTLVYFSGSTTRAGRSLVWVDRNGREVAIDAPPHEYQYPRVSPDGRRVAVDAFDQEQDVWMWELSRGAMLRFTSDLVRDTYPVWTPDGSRIIYGSFRTATASLFARRADGSGAEERLTESKATQYPQSISPDGSRLVFREDGPTQDLMMLALDGSRRIEPIVQTRFNERNGEVSPNGRWIAYESDETGTVEVYVRRFPDASSGVWGVSSGGGTRPLWSRDGSELFYISPANVLMRVRVTAGEAWGADAPVRLFEARYFFGQGTGAVGRTYDMSSDARQFLMIKESSASDADTPEGIVVVQSWLDELKRRVPAN